LVRLILEYVFACWDPCREGQINALDWVQKKGAQFTNRTEDSHWETLVQRRTIPRLCSLFKAYSGERAWKAIRDRLRRTFCWVGLIMFGKLGTGSEEWLSRSIPL
jgi:hypothetical protein